MKAGFKLSEYPYVSGLEKVLKYLHTKDQAVCCCIKVSTQEEYEIFVQERKTNCVHRQHKLSTLE